MKFKLDKNFVHQYFRIGFPMILSQLVVYLVNNLSVVMMGTISSQAISGYTCANESFSIFSMLVLGLTGGFHVYISQYYGDDNREKYNQVLRLGMKFVFVLSVAAVLFFSIFSEQFIRIFVQNDQEIIDYGVQYLRIFCWTFIPYAMNTLWSGVYQLTGRAQVTMIAGALDCLLNTLFCYILLYGKFGLPQMGIQGAALALLVARSGESLYLYWRINGKDSEFTFKEKYPPLDVKLIYNILKTSAPLIANETLFSVAYMFITKNYSYASSSLLACYTTVNNAQQLVFVITQGTSAVIGVLIGGKLGAGRLEEAKENGDKILQLTFILYALFGVVLFLLAPILPGFYSLQGELAQTATQMFRIKAFIGFGGMSMCFYNTLRIGGDTMGVFLLDGIYSCVGPLVVSYVFSHMLFINFVVLYAAIEFMQVVKCCLGYYLYRRGKWIRKLS